MRGWTQAEQEGLVAAGKDEQWRRAKFMEQKEEEERAAAEAAAIVQAAEDAKKAEEEREEAELATVSRFL